MYRYLLAATSCFLFLANCTPPVHTVPRRVKTGLDTTTYAGVVAMNHPLPNLGRNRPLAKIKVKDRGWSLDCQYPEVLQLARERSMSIGGNLLVITEHKKPESGRSDCHRIAADIFYVEQLEGLEAEIFWHPDRRLAAADLRGRAGEALPPVVCHIQHRLLGDYYNKIQIRTITTFLSDSTGRAASAGDAWDVRRAQLYFDLAELQTRQFKSKLVALAPDLTAITRQAKPLIAAAQSQFLAQTQRLDIELQNAGDPSAVISRWEADVRKDLDALQNLAGDQFISLKPPKKRTQSND